MDIKTATFTVEVVASGKSLLLIRKNPVNDHILTIKAMKQMDGLNAVQFGLYVIRFDFLARINQVDLERNKMVDGYAWQH